MDHIFCTLPEREETLKKWVHRRHADAVIPDEVPAAAGVLPFTVHNGNVHLLLGREAHRPGFRSGGLYADFGGGLMGKGRSSIECAALELQEETFKSLMDVPLSELINYIKQNVWLVVKSHFGKKVPYHLYCVRFPAFDVESIFKQRLCTAKSLTLSGCNAYSKLRATVPEAFQINGRVRKSYLEKTEIKWFTIKSVHRLPMRDEFWRTLTAFKVLERITQSVEDSDREIKAPPGFGTAPPDEPADLPADPT
jgi:hypothetical protein